MNTKLVCFAAASLATVAAVLASTPAMAQEADHSFTGPRAEINVGYDSVNYDDGGAATPDSLDAARIGVNVGYDFPIGQTFTIGAEAGIGWTLGDGKSYTAGSTTASVDAGRDIDVMLRLGAKVTPSTLLYVKGGWANSNFHGSVKTGSTVTSAETDENGWRAGIGVEQMITDRIYAKAEYRYTDYGYDVNRHQALIGVGYRF